MHYSCSEVDARGRTKCPDQHHSQPPYSFGLQTLHLDLDHAEALEAAGLEDNGGTISEQFLDQRRFEQNRIDTDRIARIASYNIGTNMDTYDSDTGMYTASVGAQPYDSGTETDIPSHTNDMEELQSLNQRFHAFENEHLTYNENGSIEQS